MFWCTRENILLAILFIGRLDWIQKGWSGLSHNCSLLETQERSSRPARSQEHPRGAGTEPGRGGSRSRPLSIAPGHRQPPQSQGFPGVRIGWSGVLCGAAPSRVEWEIPWKAVPGRLTLGLGTVPGSLAGFLLGPSPKDWHWRPAGSAERQGRPGRAVPERGRPRQPLQKAPAGSLRPRLASLWPADTARV